MTNTADRRTNWDMVEHSYRAGLLSLREIAAIHGIAHSAIDKRAKRDGWSRDLKARIQAKAQELVNRQEVNKSVNKHTEIQIVDSNATVVAGVQICHRKDIGRARTLAMRLFEELEAQTAQMPELARLGDLLASPDDKATDKLNDLYRKIISLPSRTKVMKDLSDTLRTLVTLEREAYGIDALPAVAPVDSLGAFLAGMKRSALPVVHQVEADDSL